MNQPISNNIAVFGECMLELSMPPLLADQNSAPANFAFGGDSLNMSVYLARLGSAVEYVTALGDDKASDWMIQRWSAEGVGCKHVIRCQGQVPGMYMIELDQYGERSFHYWRANSPAAKILDNAAQADAVFKVLDSFDTVFLSGISLAILRPSARMALIDFLGEYRTRGGKVVFDCNHRPHLWPEPREAIDCYKKMYQITDIALPTFEDEQMLFGYQTAKQALDAILLDGVHEVVLKMGEKGCYYTDGGEHGFVPVESAKVVDTTSAGDSFNAGYMSKRLAGASVEESCKAAHRLASTVVQHRGAIIPIEAMPS
ncbi:MAG: sugar kinase [Arenicella sp.]|nr:sugar kinase [Arenicella sp.]